MTASDPTPPARHRTRPGTGRRVGRNWAAPLTALALATAVGPIAACAGAHEPATQPATAHTTPQATEASDWRALLREEYPSPDRPWEEMSHDERKAYMRDVVVPTMEELFLAFDAETHAGFGCRTCHGATARERDYAMPNPDLFTLYPSGSPEQRRTVVEKETAARFMFNAVTPTVRALLGQPRYDKETGDGFSCFRCHPRGESESLATAAAAPEAM